MPKFKTRGQALEYFEQRIGELHQKILKGVEVENEDDKMKFYVLMNGYGDFYDQIKYAEKSADIIKAINELDKFLTTLEN